MPRPKRKLGTPEFLSDYGKIWRMLEAYRKRCEDEDLDPLAACVRLMSMAELFHLKTHSRIYEDVIVAKAQKAVRDRFDKAYLDAFKEIKEFENALRKQRQT